MPLEIPEVVISRLPVYYRLLSRIQREGQAVVSSQELGEALGVTPAQIRKDLSYFGRFGKQGRGYSVQRLTDELRRILGLERRWRMVLVGIGHLGRAIASYRGFEPQGFDIVALYDADADVIGTSVSGHTVRDAARLEAELAQETAEIGVVAVPAEHAQDVIDALVGAGIRAILCYAPRAVQVPDHVELRQVDPVISLQSITYHLTRKLETDTA
ncbi:MAG: redox-sensing transcriptional repressor Rex [Dehalococcoidia bacterium]